MCDGIDRAGGSSPVTGSFHAAKIIDLCPSVDKLNHAGFIESGCT